MSGSNIARKMRGTSAVNFYSVWIAPYFPSLLSSMVNSYLLIGVARDRSVFDDKVEVVRVAAV